MLRPTTKKRHDRIRRMIEELRARNEARQVKAPLKTAFKTLSMKGEYAYSYLRKIYYET